MKKTLSLSLLLFLFISAFAQEPDAKLFPVVNGKVMYEEIVEVNGSDQGTIHVRAFSWILNTFKDRQQIHDELGIGQSIYKIAMESGMYTINFIIQVDSKDNKYRYRIYDITHTITSQKDNVLMAKYMIDVPAETDNGIIKGEKKLYNKKQAQKIVIEIDGLMTRVIKSLKTAIDKKSETF
jgi:hypothetical protein